MTVRCNTCGTRRATFASLLRHKAASGHGTNCNCGGHPFPHRPGSSACDHNPYCRTHRARRAGAAEEEVLDAFIEDALFNVHPTTTECPF